MAKKKEEETAVVKELPKRECTTYAVYFDKEKNRYIQVKVSLDLEALSVKVLDTKELTHNRNAAIVKTAMTDLVKTLQKELK